MNIYDSISKIFEKIGSASKKQTFLGYLFYGIFIGIIGICVSVHSIYDSNLPFSLSLLFVCISFFAPILFMMFSAGLVIIVNNLFESKPDGWFPFRSKEVIEIHQNLTDTEKQGTNKQKVLFMFSIWIYCLFVISIFYTLHEKLNFSLFVSTLIICGILILSERMLTIYEKKWLCSTKWAKEKGYKPDTLRLWNFQIF